MFYNPLVTFIAAHRVLPEMTSIRIRQIIAFIKLGRFLFLGGGFLLYGLGAAMAHHTGVEIEWWLYVWGQAIVTSTQLMVHYSNDYFDYAADLANRTPTLWSGGSRILPKGELSPRVALYAALILFLIALTGIVALASFKPPGPLAIPMLLTALLLSWSYSSPPLRLHARGFGEVAVVGVVAVLTPLVGFYLQTEKVTSLPILAILPLALLQFNMILSVHWPDVEGDLTVGKRTLVVRLGRPLTARLYRAILASVYLSVPLLIFLGLPFGVGTAILLPLPVALWLFWQMKQKYFESSSHWGHLAFFSIALLMGTAALELVVFLLI